MSVFDSPIGRPQGRAAALHQGRAQQPTRPLTGRAAALHQGRPTLRPAPSEQAAALQQGITKQTSKHSVRLMAGKWYPYTQQAAALKYLWAQSLALRQEHMAIITTDGLVVLPPAGRNAAGKLFMNKIDETEYRPQQAGTVDFIGGRVYIYHHQVRLRVVGTIHTHPNGDRATNPAYYGLWDDAYAEETNWGPVFAIDHYGLKAAGWLAGRAHQALNANKSVIATLDQLFQSNFDLIGTAQDGYYKVPPYTPAK
jgi:hypothetical protein